MSRAGRWAAACAVALGIVTVATWNLGSPSAPLDAVTADGAHALVDDHLHR